MTALSDRAMMNPAFQAACQRYAHGNGSSGAIATAALAAVGAPDLLEALQWFVDDIDAKHGAADNFDDAVDRARAALSKALTTGDEA